MANIQIPNLPAVASLSGEELFEGVQAGSSVKISLGQVIAAANLGTPTSFPLPVSIGGTGGSDPASARTGLGLGSISTQDSNAISVTGGTISDITAVSPNLVGWEISGVAVTSTAAELNILDGVTATTPSLNAAVTNSTQTRDTVALLLADTTLTYTSGQTGSVTVGQYVLTRSEGFSYKVAASGATNHNVTTAGGVKLYVQPGTSGYNVQAFGAVGDGSTNDTTAVQAAINSGGTYISFPRGTYLTNAELVVNANNITLDMQGCTIQTSANAPIIRFGAGATESTATSGGGITGTLSLVGSGTGNTNNHAIVVRNHSYASFNGTFSATNIGGSSIYTTAYARGNQYNSFMGAWTISGNYGYGIQIEPDPAGGVGGYVNDNFFSGIRIFNPLAAANTQCYINGGNENRFYGCGFETSRAADTLLHIASGEGNSFYGLRLDGTNLSLALRLDSAAIANWFFGYSIDGTVTDASARNLFFGDVGSFSFPFIRFGSGDAAGVGWNIQMARPGSVDELHIGPQTAGKIVRFPSLGVYNFGDREGGDSSPVVFDPTNKRLNLNTLTSTAIGSGPSIRFDGRFSSSGNFAIQTVNQDEYGINCSFGGATYGLHSGTYISVADGVAAPAAVTGRARIYVDTADGDLKIVFGDGTVKTIVTDT